MKQRRAQVTSITERVQSLSEPGGELWLGVAAFKWQQPNRFVNILDGSGGNVNVYWGKMGPTARSGSGIR